MANSKNNKSKYFFKFPRFSKNMTLVILFKPEEIILYRLFAISNLKLFMFRV